MKTATDSLLAIFDTGYIPTLKEVERAEQEEREDEITSHLLGFHGSDTFTRITSLPQHLATEGAVALCKKAECFWLMDVIASWQNDPAVKREDFQSWYIRVQQVGGKPAKPWPGPGQHLDECSESGYAWVWCEDGHDRKDSMCVCQLVPMTDFPMANAWVECIDPRHTKDAKMRQRGAFKLYACRNELGGVTIMLPSEY